MEIITIGDYTLVQDSIANPEQYNVYLDAQAIGFIRLRDGNLTVRVTIPNMPLWRWGTAVPGADGCFEDEIQRQLYLRVVVDKLEAYECSGSAKVRRCDKPTFHDSEPHTGFVWYWASSHRAWFLVHYKKIDHGDIWLPYKDLPDPEG